MGKPYKREVWCDTCASWQNYLAGQTMCASGHNLKQPSSWTNKSRLFRLIFEEGHTGMLFRIVKEPWNKKRTS